MIVSKYKRKRILRGFTLIELMITVVIVSVFASLALASFGRGVRIQQEQDFRLKLKSFLAAGKIYYIRNGQYWDQATTDLDLINQALGTNVTPTSGFTYRNSGNASLFKVQVQEDAGTLYMQVNSIYNDVCCIDCYSKNMVECI